MASDTEVNKMEEELDEDLLALAGGDDESDEEDVEAEMPSQKSPSRSPTPLSPVAPTIEEKPPSPPRKGLAMKKRASQAKGGARRRRKEESDDEDVEESARESSPNSLGSGAMSESDSDTAANDNAADDGPLYPIEGKFLSHDDKARIMAMSEIEREGILADRAAEVERKQQDQQLRRLLAQREREADKKKRKAGAADLEDDTQRKSSRLKTKDTQLEAYKKQREERGAQRKREDDRRRNGRRSESRGEGSEVDAEGESEVEWDERPAKERNSVQEPPADLKDFERCKISRLNFARVCFWPNFQKTLTGCFSRVSVGRDPATGQNVYRMAQIKGFSEGKPYLMEGANGRPFLTNQYVQYAHGAAVKEWPMISASDAKITEAEFIRWQKVMHHEKQKISSKSFLLAKLDQIHAMLGHTWSDADIQYKVNAANEMHHKITVVYRNKLLDQRKEAIEKGDESMVAKCDSELASIDQIHKVAYGNPITQKNAPKKSQQDTLAELNRLNRKANQEEIRKALIAEKRVIQRGQEEARRRAEQKEAEAKAKEAEAKAKADAKNKLKVDDLFGDGSDISRTATPKPLSRVGTPLNGNKPERKGIPTLKKRTMDDDIIGAMDLGIDIEI